MRPFRVAIPQEALDDLHDRLSRTRWPSELPGVGDARGLPVGQVRELAAYWRDGFDWRAAEARINAFPQFVDEIDGARVHFLHVRSPEPDATPLLMTHGWPGSIAEFLDVIGPLSDPRAHGGDPGQAFHLVIPTPPGFGFSGPAPEAGWSVGRIAGAWVTLMERLGYERYALHGTDLGVWISLTLAGMRPERVIGAHVNFLLTPPSGEPGEIEALNASDRERVAALGGMEQGSGYMRIQSTRPQTLGYGLTDSPAGQLAWVAEKFHAWTDDSVPGGSVDRDQLLTNVSLYWFTATGGSSAQLYYEMADQLPGSSKPQEVPPPLPVPLAVTVHPYDSALPVRSLAAPRFPEIVQWSEFDRGGHFPAMEVPELFVADVRSFIEAARARDIARQSEVPTLAEAS
ncbi:epoxide hydrolase family protein [Streptomyces sp. NBC_00209]|uniref:epoxide hydrolase family protein n=1 Tax=Streptomyces sp. NBC_00209 TaxID=2975682 RepID=UPI002F914F86